LRQTFNKLAHHLGSGVSSLTKFLHYEGTQEDGKCGERRWRSKARRPKMEIAND
jgi:hypothetical protein